MTTNPIEELFQHHVQCCQPDDPCSPDWFCGFAAALSLVDEGLSNGSTLHRGIILAMVSEAMRLQARVRVGSITAMN